MGMSKGFALLLVLVFLLSSFTIVVKLVSAASATENTWVTKAPMPEYVWGKAVMVDGKIYVIGAHYLNGSSAVGSANYQYDPATDKWVAETPMPTPREHFGIAAYDHKIFVIGGSILNGNAQSAVNEVYIPSNDTWKSLAPIPSVVTYVDANCVNGIIYVISGLSDTSKPANVEVNLLNEAYYIASNSWTTKSPMPYPVYGYTSAALNNKIYIVGGQLAHNSYSNSTQIYDCADDSWSFGAPIPIDYSGCTAAATTGINSSKRIYVIGGYLGSALEAEGVNFTQVYNPENDSWFSGAPMPTARWTSVAVFNDMLFAIGGNSNAQLGTTVNEQYIPFGYGTPDTSYGNNIIPEYTPTPFFMIFVTVFLSVVSGLLVFFKKHKH